MTAWIGPAAGQLVACETVAAVVLHVRRIVDRGVRLSGHVAPRPLALCGTPIAWDTRLPVSAVTCRRCEAVLKREAAAP